MSTQYATCGRDSSQYGYIGYNCKLPTNTWKLTTSAQIPGTSTSSEDVASIDYALAMSSQGNFLAVGTPGSNKVSLYDRRGKKWSQRGTSLSGPSGSYFGSRIRVSSGGYNFWNTPSFLAPYFILVGAPGQGNGTVTAYQCGSAISSDCRKVYHQWDGYNLFDVSDDGSIVALGENKEAMFGENKYAVFGAERAAVDIFSTSGPAPMFQRRLNVTYASRPGTANLYSLLELSLSGRGERLAFQTAVIDVDYSTNCIGDSISCKSRFVVNSIVGDDIEHTVIMEEAVTEEATGARPVLISADGNVLAFASLNCSDPMVNLFSLADNYPVRLPAIPAIPEKQCTSEFSKVPMSMALTKDGRSIALGYSGRVHVYDLNQTAWTLIDEGLNAEDALAFTSIDKISLALSSLDGTVLVECTKGSDITTKFNDLLSVLSTPQRKDFCKPGRSVLRVSVTTDNTPNYLSWRLFHNGTQQKSLVDSVPEGYYIHPFANHVHEICVPSASSSSTCHILTFYKNLKPPIYHKSLTPPGRIDIALDNEMQHNIAGFENQMKRVFVGRGCLRCSSGSSLFQMMLSTCDPVAWELRDRFDNVLFQGGGLGDNAFDSQYEVGFAVSNVTSSIIPNTTLLSMVANATINDISSLPLFSVGETAYSNNETQAAAERPSAAVDLTVDKYLNSQPSPCNFTVHHEDICLVNVTQSCYIFSVTVPSSGGRKDGDGSGGGGDDGDGSPFVAPNQVHPTYSLFVDGTQIHQEELKSEGVYDYYIGRCPRG